MQAPAGDDPLDSIDEQSTSDDSSSSKETSSSTETQSLDSASDSERALTSRAAAPANRRGIFDEDSSSDGSNSSYLNALSNGVQGSRDDECIANWQTWAAAADAQPSEQRATALNRVIKWVDIGDYEALLDLPNLSLNSRLPALPQGLEKLTVARNRKIELTELPESLEEFDANECKIKVLPKLSHTQI